MHSLAYLFGLFLGPFLLCNARHTVSIEENTYLPSFSEDDVCMTPKCVLAASDILTSLDETVDPCDDFYSFACGGWLDRQELSEKEEERNIFSDTKNKLDQKLIDLLVSEYNNSDPPFVQMLKDYYNTCVDLDTLEIQGSEPLNKMLRRLGGGWPVVEGSQWDESSFDWVDTLISFRLLGYDFRIMFGLDVYPDPQNKTVNVIVLKHPPMDRLSEANLSLGLDDPKIGAYYEMMTKAAKLLGADDVTAEKEMLEALHFEMALMKFMKEDKHDFRSETQNTIAEIESPHVPWLRIMNGLFLTDQVYENDIIVNKKTNFLVKLAELISSTDKRVIANYMLWRAVLESKDLLSKEWEDLEECDENDKSSMKCVLLKMERWELCLKLSKIHMEIGLSSYYVRKYFSEESKDEAMMMMKYIHKEFMKILEENDWMDETTRKKAEEKAEAIKMYIGYPQELLNDTLMMKIYENLNINNDSFLENVLAVGRWKTDKQLIKLRNPSDISLEIQGTKYQAIMKVDAQYFPRENSIRITAGILHDSFYDKDRPNYMNFAAVGYTIGHEITHGFDNEGRYYDKNGAFFKWWDKESDEKFLKKAKCIIDQYDNYTTYLGIKVNGEMTQNENIADNGGMKEAYLAYQSWTKDHGVEPLLPGVNYTQDQIFWVSVARVWCTKYQPRRLIKLLYTDVHSPGKFRIIGPMSNLPEFSKDFKCSPDAPMNRKYKCEVW